jgi:signal peptidase I
MGPSKRNFSQDGDAKMSGSIRKFRSYLRKNETARGLFLVGLVIIGAIAVWGGIRLALNTEYPILVVSSGSMCPPSNCVLPVGALVVIQGEDPSALKVSDIIVFRGNPSDPNYLIIHRIIIVYTPSNDTAYPGQYGFVTHGDANPPGFNEGPNPASALVGIYQFTIPIPYLGSGILWIRNFMYDDSTGQPKTQGILVIVALIVALFAFEVAEPEKKTPSSKVPEETKTSVAPANVLRLGRRRGFTRRSRSRFFLVKTGLA